MEKHKADIINKAIDHFENDAHDSNADEEELEEVKTSMQEVVYLTGEKIKFSDDVYSLTIAAGITRDCTPTEYMFCLRQCAYVFVFQMAIAYYFAAMELDFGLFSTECFNIWDTIMRLICALLLQIKLNKELKNAFRVMTYLKYQNVTPKN